MSQNESVKVGKSGGDSVSIYRVALVRESSVIESTTATPIQKSSEAAEILRPLFAELDREQFVVLMLDAQHRPLGMSVISIGSLTASIVHPREVFKAAILSNSAAVIIAHNHPSGEPTPSEADIKITRDLIRAGQLLKIDVLDHIIMGNPNHSSLRTLGYFL